jgi:hypothetical protein
VSGGLRGGGHVAHACHVCTRCLGEERDSELEEQEHAHRLLRSVARRLGPSHV